MKTSKLFREILVNFLIWVVSVTVFIYLVTYVEQYNEPNAVYTIKAYRFIPMAIVLATVSVLHYYWLYTVYFQNGRYVKYVLMILLLLLCSIALDNIAVIWLFEPIAKVKVEYMDALSSSIMRNVFFYTPAAIFYTLIKANLNLRKRRQQLEQQQLESNIAALKSQLDPHFLFNTLNVLYATAHDEKAVKTASAIEELSELFRYSISEAGRKTVSVEQELAFIDKYLHLQRLRLPEHENVRVNTAITWDHKQAEIAPMLLLPFIENAFKYGISYKKLSEVDIKITIENARLMMMVHNTDNSGSSAAVSTGIGLKNVKERLQLQYEGKHELEHKHLNGMYIVSLTIQL